MIDVGAVDHVDDGLEGVVEDAVDVVDEVKDITNDP